MGEIVNIPYAMEIESKTPCRVLCVDDNQDSADMESLLLELSGFETRACYDGASALTQARSYLPNLCLIDLNMPGMDGDELAIRLRRMAELRPLLLIAVTAMNSEESCNRIQIAGFNLQLLNPVEPESLVRTVSALCQARYSIQ